MGEPRFPTLEPGQLDQHQTEIANKIAGGPRGGLRGPYLALIYHPDLADVVQQVGEHLRFKSKLPAPLIELAILIVARHWTCQFEWIAHERVARTKTDLPDELIRAIQNGDIPPSMDDDQKVVHDFVVRTIKHGEPTNRVYDAVVERFGRQGVLDLIATCGYYTMIALLLNTTQVPLPDDAAAPLREMI